MQFQKISTLPYRRFFVLHSPHPRKFQFIFIHCFWKFKLLRPPFPLWISNDLPCMRWVWSFSGTTQSVARTRVRWGEGWQRKVLPNPFFLILVMCHTYLLAFSANWTISCTVRSPSKVITRFPLTLQLQFKWNWANFQVVNLMIFHIVWSKSILFYQLA